MKSKIITISLYVLLLGVIALLWITSFYTWEEILLNSFTSLIGLYWIYFTFKHRKILKMLDDLDSCQQKQGVNPVSDSQSPIKDIGQDSKSL